MNRLIVVAPNNQFPRVSTRPALNPVPAHPPLRRENYSAGLSSGVSPDAAAGGSRHPSVLSRTSSSSQPFPELEVHFAGTVLSLFVVGCLTVALLTLVLL